MKVQIASYQNKKKFAKKSLKMSENEEKQNWLKNLKKFCLSKFAYFEQYANFKSQGVKIFIPQKTPAGMEQSKKFFVKIRQKKSISQANKSFF